MNALIPFHIKNSKGVLFLIFLVAILVHTYFYDWESDEAWTYLAIQNNNFFDIVSFSKFKFANNHVLNSLYFKLLQYLDITSVFWFRLLSLLGFSLYFYASSKMLELFKLSHGLLLFLIITPYFGFFALGRGYALGLGCLAMSLMYLIQFMNTSKLKYEYFLVAFAAMSALSMLSFLYTFLSTIAIYILFKGNQLKNIHSFFLLGFVLLVTAYIYDVGKIINEDDPNIAGSDSLFKNGAISSMISDFSFYTRLQNLKYYKYFKAIIALCFVVPFFYSVLIYLNHFRLKFEYILNAKTSLFIIIVLSFAMMVLANVFFHAKFPMGRAIMNIEYILLVLLLLCVTVSYAPRLWFYIPISILCATSFLRITSMYTNLLLPDFKAVIIKTGDKPFYVLGALSNVLLTNQLKGIHKKEIYQVYGINNLKSALQQDTAHLIYVLSHSTMQDSLSHNPKKVSDCRDGMVLYSINQ